MVCASVSLYIKYFFVKMGTILFLLVQRSCFCKDECASLCSCFVNPHVAGILALAMFIESLDLVKAFVEHIFIAAFVKLKMQAMDVFGVISALAGAALVQVLIVKLCLPGYTRCSRMFFKFIWLEKII